METSRKAAIAVGRRRLVRGCLLLVGALLLTVGNSCLIAGDQASDSHSVAVQFNRDIRPILANKCFHCHGPDADYRQAGLRLDTLEGAIAELDFGTSAIVPGNPDESELIRRIESQDEFEIMPPEDSGKILTDQEKHLLRVWIADGAAYEKHWSLVPVQRPALPAVDDSPWCRNEIDVYVLAKLEKTGLSPAAEVDRATLIRRVSFDLIGLPPTIDEVESFQNDGSPDAYEKVVDRLLASKHFGEKWGRHWLDVARYADSAGHEFDTKREMWHYRDWVINSLNEDLPYDQFLIQQLAGDLLSDATIDQRIATGFSGNALQQYGDTHETTIDRVNAFGIAFLGLTLGCAQCHDHKFDELSQKEYFQLYAFFDQAEDTELNLSPPEVVATHTALTQQISTLKKELAIYQNGPDKDPLAWAAQLRPDEIRALSTELREAVLRLSADRTDKQVELVQQEHKRRTQAFLTSLRARIEGWYQQLSPEQLEQLGVDAKHYFEKPTDERPVGVPPSVLAKFWEQDFGRIHRTEIISHLEEKLPPMDKAMVMQQRHDPPSTRVFIRGDYRNLGPEVEADIPHAIPPFGESHAINDRLDLAHWVVSRENPLTARVAVNRAWQILFGVGIVETSENFGAQTPLPEHHELLDWLATELMETGWGWKELIRKIVTSSTYRQSSHIREDVERIDPQNRLWGRQKRIRLEAEAIRDAALSTSGLIDLTIGGPSVFPYQPEGIMVGRADGSTWTESEGSDRYRRSLYTHYWRLTPHPYLSLFDVPDASEACTRRSRSNTPIQALTLLNDPVFMEAARRLAERLESECSSSESFKRMHWLFQTCLGRVPGPEELHVLDELLRTQRQAFQDDIQRARQVVRIENDHSLEQQHVMEQAAWISVCRAILNLDEFITRE